MRIRWLNDGYVAGEGDANIRIGAINFNINKAQEVFIYGERDEVLGTCLWAGEYVIVIDSYETFLLKLDSLKALDLSTLDNHSAFGLIEKTVPYKNIVYDEERNIIRSIDSDDNQLSFQDGLINAALDSNNVLTTYNFGCGALDNVDNIEIVRNGISRLYNKYGDLQSLTLDDMTKVVYENGEVSYIEKPDGTKIKNITFSETGDFDGGLISYPDGSTAIYSDNELLQIISGSGTVDCSDGQIRTVTLDDGSKYDWNYDGDLIRIYDHTNDEYRWYLEGQLQKVEEMSGAELTTNYYYEPDNKLSKTEISKDDEILYAYTYSYEDNLTRVHDENNNIQAYNADKILTYVIDSQGRQYDYTYVNQNDGYIEVTMPDLSKVTYDENANIIEITKADGTVINDITFDVDNNPMNFEYTKDNVTYMVENGHIKEAVSEEGETITYGRGDFIEYVDNGQDDIKYYSYVIKDAEFHNSFAAFSSGNMENIIFHEGSEESCLELERPMLDLGDGSDGVLEVFSTLLIEGTKNYESVYVAPGATLLLRHWDGQTGGEAIIKCQGDFIIEGAIDAVGKGYRGGTGAYNAGYPGAQGESYTGQGTGSITNNAGGGGGGVPGIPDVCGGSAGAGGGYGTPGGTHSTSFGIAIGGQVYGDAELSVLHKGSGGGGGAICSITQIGGGAGGAGGGAIKILAHDITVGQEGYINADGGNGSPSGGYGCGGGGGSGGSVWLIGENIDINGYVTANGGQGADSGKNGGDGRIRMDYVALTGAGDPASYNRQLESYPEGTFTSDVMDIEAASLDNISWIEDLPEGTEIAIQTRTGDDPDNLGSWSDPLTDAAGSQITSQPARYIQYKITLSTTDTTETPKLVFNKTQGINIDYRRGPHEASDINKLESIEVIQGDTASTYNANGVNILDSEDTIDVVALVFDSAYMDDIKEGLPSYFLNETQKRLYFTSNVIVTELASIEGVDNSLTSYRGGQISRIVTQDGTIIRDVHFDEESGLPQDFTYEKDDTIYTVEDGLLVRAEKTDGTIIEYYDNGWIESVTNPDGSVTEYDHAISDDVSPLPIGMEQEFVEIVDIGDDRALRISSYADPYLSLLLNLNGEQDDAYTSDSSDRNHSISLIGDACLDTTYAKFGSGSIYLDGTGDYLSMQTTSDLSLGSNWTFDFWAYGHSGGHIWGSRTDNHNNANLCVSATNMIFYEQINSGWQNYFQAFWPEVSSDEWHHYAIERNGSTWYVFVDGVSQIIVPSYGPTTPGSYSVPFNVGTNASGSYFIGYVDEFRFSQSARWTSDFTPPQSEYDGTLCESDTATFVSTPIRVGSKGLKSISWSEIAPPGTEITFQIKTGNSEDLNDGSWSEEWSEPLTDPSGSALGDLEAEYIQYKINLSTDDASANPAIIFNETDGMNIDYLRNPVSLGDIEDLAYIKITQGGITSTYGADGKNIDGSGNSIVVESVIEDSQFTEEIKEEIINHKLSNSQKVITVYDKGSDTPVQTISADHSITHYEDGYATRVEDKDGTLLVRYTYSDDKKLLNTEFVYAREKLEESKNVAITEIAKSKDEALKKLDEAEAAARKNIEEQKEVMQYQIDYERQRLNREKEKYSSGAYDLSEFDRIFAELDAYQSNLDTQTVDAVSTLEAQIEQARLDIEENFSQAMFNLIYNDYNTALGDIVQKESSPVIYFYYRDVLGRDPDAEELAFWLNKAKSDLASTDPSELTQHIETLEEYTQRQAWKQNIINDVTSFFSQYLSADEHGKESMLADLGLVSSDVSGVDLTQDDVDEIMSWLDSQSLHFGDSAFKTVIDLLVKEGITKTFEEIGKDCIKIDILTGVITKDTEGDLLISMYAMKKIAGVNGLVLLGEKLDYAELKTQSTSGSGLILHINKNHYVILSEIDEEEGTVTYKDMSVGASGQEMIVSRAEFMEEWDGYALSTSEISAEADTEECRYLNDAQEKNIRGSGWWEDFWKGIVGFFQMIIAPIASILIMIPIFPINLIGAALHGLNIIIQTISFVARTGTLMDVAWAAINAAGSYLASCIIPGIFKGIKDIFTPLKGAFTNCMNVFDVVAIPVKDITTRVGQIVTLGIFQSETIAASIGLNIIATAVNFVTNIAIDAIGWDNPIMNIASSIFTGAFMGMISVGNPVGMIAEAIKYGTMTAIDEIGTVTNLDPNITKLAGMMAGSIIGGAITVGDETITYDQLMENIAPNILSECAYIGVTKFGELLGIDPRISYLAGIGIRSSLEAGFSNAGSGIFDVDSVWEGAMTGLAQGTASIGLNYLTEEFNLNPLLANIGFSALSLGIEGLINETGFFEHVFGT
ncbi:MAG: hypothetical protein HQ579_09025, partial [Candidatus Omnitrophica bacterium]|nr:hypothetical protein [Candidatus Omnitrophota bacterium]